MKQPARASRRRRNANGHVHRPRRKRASATQLYQTCKAAGTCPPDVIPKVEGTTVADQILRYGSMGVYFGGLGIGTAPGSGGRSGYVPLGSRPATVPEVLPRPPVLVEPVAPSDPSIVSLVEEANLIDAGLPAPSVPTGGGFTVTTSDVSTPAILPVTPAETSVHVTVDTFTNPLFTEPSVFTPPPPMEATGHIVLSSDTVSAHSYEEIPMDTFVVTGDNAYNPTSTPIPTPRPRARLGLYGRGMQQVRVSDPAFLSSPARLITFDNPAYEGLPEDSLQFEHSSIHQPPDPDFLDIVALHRPALTSRQGTVRYSRVGNRATIRTRSGKQIGARVHFFQDISAIPHPEEIEMQPLVSAQEPLFDVYADLEDAPEVEGGTGSATSSSVPPLQGSATWNTTVPLNTGLDILVQPGPDVAQQFPVAESPYWPAMPVFPQGHVYVSGGDFLWHPSLYTPRRKRKRVHTFFADVSVAA
ncbi:minor capsid protein [Macaca fascicularis papillomavirus 11]|uniref:Minor capsid protein L2 n=1 Tax=Macaca fascicularis papillomavirus 11 TaxID=656889 RepID=C7DY57_RHPV1|nr:minor capsid protein [Macaca fascicularis papillomavirus 11]